MLRHAWQRLKSQFPRRTPGADYDDRVVREREFYANCENVHDLPEIFHYWSNRYLVPMQQPFGFTNPDAFFFTQLENACLRNPGRRIRVISIGAGNCDLEARLAKDLLAAGHENFGIECLDLNADMIERGRAHARKSGVETHIDFVQGDFNKWQGAPAAYDVVMANQSLHHVLELEHLFDTVESSLRIDGTFLVSDMIGRNGHMRWPEALAAMQPFWEELPHSYRYNRIMKRHEDQFVNHDCSTHSFEGVRAQDILPLLVDRFEFELFLPYGNIIFPFIDRPFGHNFNADADWDRDFIDRVHKRDERGLLSGELTPTSMLAVLRKEPVETQLRDPRLTPKACIRTP